MKSIGLIMAMTAVCTLAVSAQDSEPKFTIKPSARILLDGAMYMGGNGDVTAESGDTRFVDGVAIPDFRLGAKASYGKWSGKVDVGFAYGKVGMKDVYLKYNFNPFNDITAGYFVPQFGLNSETSSVMKPSYEEPTSNEFFNANPRLLAIQYTYNKDSYFAAASVFAEANAMKDNATAMGKQAWGAQTRLVWRPRHVDGDAFQIGCSFNYSAPNNEDHTGFLYTSNFPSRVSKVLLQQADITHARGMFKMTPELLLLQGRFALEAQYYYLNTARKDGFNNYRAQGAYGMLRTMLIGSRYIYSMGACGMDTPLPGTLEAVLDYNYTNASDSKAGIFGGVTNDISCTFNYYINKYMIARLRYSYTTVRDRVVEDLLPKRHVNILEVRLQASF
ncbi:MAG: OprO/OprP family phosphate-selective porin [Paramuribaculum sp.]|nr:OprO/OprP family phosphate-selective porin [Paramuribaculum sp.]MDE7237143.1 OprO/OprP family phosphate-selective porin [Paramuribaculum sp.]